MRNDGSRWAVSRKNTQIPFKCYSWKVKWPGSMTETRIASRHSLSAWLIMRTHSVRFYKHCVTWKVFSNSNLLGTRGSWSLELRSRCNLVGACNERWVGIRCICRRVALTRFACICMPHNSDAVHYCWLQATVTLMNVAIKILLLSIYIRVGIDSILEGMF